MQHNQTIQLMPGARDSINLGDPEHTLEASGLHHLGNTTGTLDYNFRAGEQQALDCSILGKKEEPATTTLDWMARGRGQNKKVEQQKGTGLGHLGRRAKKKEEPKDDATGLDHPSNARALALHPIARGHKRTPGAFGLDKPGSSS